MMYIIFIYHLIQQTYKNSGAAGVATRYVHILHPETDYIICKKVKQKQGNSYK